MISALLAEETASVRVAVVALLPVNPPFVRCVCYKRLKMSDEDEFLQKARAGFEDLCRALNMDEEASTEAWKTYENISRNFTLEVNTQTHPLYPVCSVVTVSVAVTVTVPGVQ